MSEIRICLYCGEHDLEVNQYNTAFAVHCKQCGAIGPLTASPELAITAWNNRVPESLGLSVNKARVEETEIAALMKCPFYPTHECQNAKCMMWVWMEGMTGRCGLVQNFGNLSYDGVDNE